MSTESSEYPDVEIFPCVVYLFGKEPENCWMVKTRLLHLVLPRRYGFRKRKLIPPLSLFSRFVLHSFAKNLSLLLSRFRKEIRHLAVLLWVPWEQRESSQFMQKSCVLGGLIEHSASRVIQWESRFHEFPVFLVSY